MSRATAINLTLNEREALLQGFAAEAQEILADMEGALVALETRPGDREMLDSLRQSVGRLEGSAERASFDWVRELTSDLAALLERLRALATPLGAEHVSLLQRTLDALLESTADAVTGDPAPRPAVAALREQLARAASASALHASGGEHGSIDLALRSVVAGSASGGEAGPAEPDEESAPTPMESEGRAQARRP